MRGKANISVVIAAAMILSMVIGCERKTPETQPSELTRVKLLIDWKAEPTYAGFYMAREKGFYKSRGLDVEIVEGSGATTSAQVIGVGESYFIGSCSGAATAIARSKGIPVKSVAVFYHDVPTVLYSRADTPIRKPSDMIGKRIGLIDGSISVDEYRAVVAANELDRSEIDEISVGWDVAPLLNRQVDGLMNYEELTPVQLRLQGHDIVVMRFSEFGIQAYSLNLIVNDNALVERTDTVEAIRDATIEGYEFVRVKPDEAAAIFCRLFPERSKEYVKESMKIVARLLGDGPVGQQTTPGWSATIQTLDELGLLAKPVTVEEVAASNYVTP